MCLCGQKHLVDTQFIQLRNDATAPLIQIGSKCVKKFIHFDETSRTRRICMDCRLPFRSTKEETCLKCQIDKRLREVQEQRKIENDIK